LNTAFPAENPEMICPSRHSNTDTTQAINHSSARNPCVLHARMPYLSVNLTRLVITAELLVLMAKCREQKMTELMRLNVHLREERLAQVG